MISQDNFYGGAQELNISGNTPLVLASGRVVIVLTAVANSSLVLDNALTLKTGAPIYFIVNKSVNPVKIKNAIGTILYTLNQNDCLDLALFDNSTSAGVWAGQIGTSGSVANPPSPLRFNIIGGGDLHNNSAPTLHNYEFTPNLNSWATKADAPATTAQGRTFVIGASAYLVYLLHLYQLSANVWVTKTPPNQSDGSSNYPATSVGSIGVCYRFFSFTGAETYDSAGDSWTTKVTTLSNDFQGSGDNMFTLAGLAYFFGGYGETFPHKNWTFTYDYTIDTYNTVKTPRPAPPTNRAAGFSIGNYVYILGGGDNTSFQSDINSRYDYSTDSWITSLVPLPITIETSQACSIAGKGYITNGIQNGIFGTGNNAQRTFEYTDTLDSWVQKADSPRDISGIHHGVALTP